MKKIRSPISRGSRRRFRCRMSAGGPSLKRSFIARFPSVLISDRTSIAPYYAPTYLPTYLPTYHIQTKNGLFETFCKLNSLARVGVCDERSKTPSALLILMEEPNFVLCSNTKISAPALSENQTYGFQASRYES